MLEDLVVTKKLTSAPRADQKANLTAVAAQRLYGRGVRLRPGQTLEYMITDGEARVPNDRVRSYALWKSWHCYPWVTLPR